MDDLDVMLLRDASPIVGYHVTYTVDGKAPQDAGRFTVQEAAEMLTWESRYRRETHGCGRGNVYAWPYGGFTVTKVDETGSLYVWEWRALTVGVHPWNVSSPMEYPR